MLNRTKLLQTMTDLRHILVKNQLNTSEWLASLWHKIADDTTLATRAAASAHAWNLPGWTNRLDQEYDLEQEHFPYTVIAIDGSQIYPDRHQGIPCFLINIGSVLMCYGSQHSTVRLESVPYVIADAQNQDWNTISPEIVNCRRTEFELRTGVELSRKVVEAGDKQPQVVLFDGSLIFWHLDDHEPEIKHRFLTSYLTLMQQFYTSQSLLAGYISYPKSKELVNIMRFALWSTGQDTTSIDHLTDTDIASLFLKPNNRSAVFVSNSPTTISYPNHLKPCFLYVQTAQEIARIEIPAWIAAQPTAVTFVARSILDQAHKGHGYPISLAEAHEQAVIKGADRDFFYHLLQKLTIEQKQHYKASQKSFKKQRIGI
jgi:hypothetical protein